MPSTPFYGSLSQSGARPYCVRGMIFPRSWRYPRVKTRRASISISCRALFLILFNASTTSAQTAPTTRLTLEGAGPGGDVAYGSQQRDPIRSGVIAAPLVRDGLAIDVRATTPPGQDPFALHVHEVDSLSNFKVPDRPVAQRGVLWRDSAAGQDPLVIAAANGTSFTGF